MFKKFNLIEANTIDEFWDLLSPQKTLAEKPSQFIYRGQRDADWNLIPSILRKNSPSKVLFDQKDITAEEQIFSELAILEEFVKQCDLLGLKIVNDSVTLRENLKPQRHPADKVCIDPAEWPSEQLIELMALAQHHGVPTQLLDWSKRSYVAAYFAASTALAHHNADEHDRKIAVWALNIEEIGFYRSIRIIKVPGSTSSNLAAQSGLFTVLKQAVQRGQSFPYKPLEDELGAFPHTPLWKITLPVNYAEKVLDLCDLYGVSASTLFSGFDGAAKAVRDWINKYRYLNLLAGRNAFSRIHDN